MQTIVCTHFALQALHPPLRTVQGATLPFQLNVLPPESRDLDLDFGSQGCIRFRRDDLFHDSF